MKTRKYSIPFSFIVMIVLLLQSCNLAVSSPGGLPPVVLSQTQSVPVAITPLPSLTTTPTFTPTNTPMPTPTWTLFFEHTATPTRQWSACPGIVITQTDTDDGDMYHILRCEDGMEYELGPLAKGMVAVGPNDKFLIYITLSGMVYGSRIGELRMLPLFNLKHEHIFTVFNIGTEPVFVISFSDGTPTYKLVLVEKSYDQKRMYDLPTRLTH